MNLLYHSIAEGVWFVKIRFKHFFWRGNENNILQYHHNYLHLLVSYQDLNNLFKFCVKYLVFVYLKVLLVLLTIWLYEPSIQ